MAYAKRQHVRAWFAKGDEDFVLLGTFREGHNQIYEVLTWRNPKKTDDSIVTVADRAPKSLAEPAAVTNADVARRAYSLYLARGCEPGHDVDDWLKAERELRGRSTTPEVAAVRGSYVAPGHLTRIRAEYLEMPGLRLTPDQTERLCGVERALCQIVLDALVNDSSCA